MKPQIPRQKNKGDMRELSGEEKKKLGELGLHYCTYYENIVRYNAPTCRKCPHSTYQKNNTRFKHREQE